MKERIWKEVLEGIGIVAIVVSLVFVGMQLKQTQEVAVAEGLLSMLEIKNEVSSSIKDNAEIWNKAKAGGDLSDSEALTFAILVNQINDLVYFNYLQDRTLSYEGSDVPVHDFAAFLYNNPAAKETWLAREDYLVRSRNLIDAGLDDVSFWREMVMKDVAALESVGSPVRPKRFVDW